jgi:hypothetical protein
VTPGWPFVAWCDMADASTCVRCGASPVALADDGGCTRCGAPPVADTAEALRQERALAWALQQIADADDVAVTARTLLERHSTRARLLSASLAPPPSTSAPPDTDHAAAAPTAAAPTTETATPTTTKPTPATVMKTPRTPRPDDVPEGVGIGAPLPPRRAPPAKPAPARRPLPPPRPVLTPAEARAQFERRLEIGGWFTGALFAVGGSLWATNLFWSDIPAALRPVVVGVGLAAFAAAFMAVGAVLAKRHPDSLAGHVLGLVGRLIGVSSTIPLAMLRLENPVLWLPTTAVIVGALGAALRFTRRGDDVDAGPSGTATIAFLAGFVLATLAPTSPWLALPVAAAALFVARAGIAARTLPALAGARTFVDDLGGIGVGLAGAFSALFHARESLGTGSYAAWFAVAIVAAVELVARLVEQRPTLFALRGLARWALALWSIGTAFSVVGGDAPLAAVVGFAFVAVAFHAPGDLGLPRLFSLVGVVALAVAAACATRLLSLGGDTREAVEVIAGLATLLGLTGQHRRGPPDRGEQIASIALYLVAFGVALFVDDDAGRVVATTIAALLFLSDRRLERSVVFGLLTIGVALVPVGLAANLVVDDSVMPVMSGVLVVAALALHQLRLLAPTRPLLAVCTAATWWIIALGALAAFAAPEHGTGLVTTGICAAGLLLLLERSRQVVVGLAGLSLLAVVIAVLTKDALALTSLRPALAVAAVIVTFVAFSPRHAWSHGRALGPDFQPLGRSRVARSWAASLVGTVLVVTLLVLRLPMIPGETDLAARGATALLVLASVLLAVRRPGRGALAVVVVALAVAGAELGVALGLAPSPVLAMGLGAGLVAFLAAAAVVVVRQRRLQTGLFARGQRRRRPPVPALPVLWGTVVGVVVATDLLALAGIADLDTVDAVFWYGAVLWALGAAHAFALFCGRAVSPLVSVGVLGLAAAALTLAARALAAGQELPTLSWALAAVAVAAVALIASRALYRHRDVPALCEAWPAASSLRRPGLAILTTLSALLAVTGFALQVDAAHAIASRYGPGLVIVAVAVGLAAVIAWRVRRTVPVALVGAALLGLVGAGIDGVAHAAHWVPKSFGDSQALIAIALVVAVLLLERDRGRALLVRLTIGWPRRVRGRLVDAIAIVVPLLAALAALLAVREAPRAHELAVLLAGLALVGLALVLPREATARLGAVGVVLVGAGVAAALARLAFGHDVALQEETLPTVALGGLLGALVVQALGRRLWNSTAMQTFHADRLATDDDLLLRCARAMRGAVEGQGLVLLAIVVAVAIADRRTEPLALWSTWFAAALAVLLTSRMAVDAARTWPAALGQGMALFIYVDIRRRTPWLDDVAGVDVIACLGAAVVFIVITAASRRQPKGASTARAAEVYAVTLPVIAAGLGDSDAGRAIICLVAGGLYAVLSQTRRRPAYEFAAGLALVAATTLALSAQHVDDATLYLLPVAFVGTFLARRHRSRLGALGRSLAVWCHVPLYCASAWSALKTGTFTAFALGVVVATIGVVYSMRAKDRRSLYAAASAAAVLVVGRLVLLGLDNALLGTVLLAGAGILLLAGMTIFTIRRDAATDAVKRATAGLDDWD